MDHRKQSVQSYFDNMGGKYGNHYIATDSLASYPSGPMREEKALSLIIPGRSGGTVLDAGCGSGHFACELASVGFEVKGIDISTEMITDAKRYAATKGLGNDIVFTTGDIENLDIPDQSIDVVTALGVIEYLSSDDKMLSELRRIIRPNGLVVIAFRNRLFNLFSSNQYTMNEFVSGNPAELLSDYLSEVESLSIEDFEDYGTALSRLIKENGRVEVKHQEAKPPSTDNLPVELRQHTPREVRDQCEKFGLFSHAIRYFHFHPFPPIFQDCNPEFFNGLGLAMETLCDTPIGASMASGFVGAFKPI